MRWILVSAPARLRATLALIREHLPPGFIGTLTVYAAACRLSAATLKRERVQFRQTPYDLNAGLGRLGHAHNDGCRRASQ